MARRNRSFLFDNISKRLVQNTRLTAKEINVRKEANDVANTDILTSLETDTKISATISNTGINTLSDISIANVVADQVLQYNANTGNWENETLIVVSSVDGLTDTSLSSVQQDDYLKYDGSNWINSALDLSSYATTTYVDDQVANVSVDLSSYSTTTQMNTAIASSNTAMKNYVDAEVSGIVNSAPATLDTLNELAAALGDDPDFATTTATNIGTKLAKSSNLSDLTNAATARTNLGLGTAATTASTDYAPASSLSNYVLKTGDTMTGALVVDDALGATTVNGAGMSTNRGLAYFGTASAGQIFNIQTDTFRVQNQANTTTHLQVNSSGAAVLGNAIWHAGNDGSGSGLDADTVDGIQGASFLRSDATDTATGTITFSGGINVGELSNGGITGSNYNITGVNALTINDPGEGIIFGGGSTTVTLYAIDDSTDSIMNFSNASELRVNNNKVWTASNDGSGSGLDADNLDGLTWDSSGKNVRATEFYADNWFRNYNSGEGLYNQATTQHFYSDDDDGWNIAGGTGANWLKFRAEHNGTIQGWLYADTISQGFLNVAGSWQLRSRNASGQSPNWWFIEGSNVGWTGNPGNDEGKIEYHSDRFYIAAGANSNRICQFRRAGSDVSYIDNSGTFIGNISGSSGSCTGNAATATRATRLSTSRTIALSGDVTGSVNFNGDANATITTTVNSVAWTNVSGRPTVGAGAAYLDLSTANYGTVKVDDDRSVTWAGYTIRDDWSLMSNGAEVFGVLTDSENVWMFFINLNVSRDLLLNCATIIQSSR